MRKNSYIFTAILAIVVSTGAWAYAPGNTTDDGSTAVGTGAHDVYTDAPIDGEASEGIAGVTYVNRVANRAGAAAQAAENHAAHASKSAYDAATAASNAATAASNAQASADIAAAVINNLQAGNGVTVEDVKSADGKSTVGKKVSAKISDGLEFVASGDNEGAITVKIGNGLKKEQSGALAIDLDATAATNTTLGSVYILPDSNTMRNTPNIFDEEYQKQTAISMMLLTELGNEGMFDNVVHYKNDDTIIDTNGSSDTLEDLYNSGDGEGMIKRPLSAFGAFQLSKEVEERTVQLPQNSSQEVITHNVGSDSRPVYVKDDESDGRTMGVITPIQSVAIPVDADNFENATTTAKIWIQ